MVPSLSMLGVRCQPGPWLLASSQRVGKWKGLPGLSWSLSDPDIKHDAVLAMHFVLLSCEPRVYKPTGRMVSSSSWALPVLLLAAGTSLVHAPELQMGLCCHFLLAYERKKKKKREIKQILAVCLFLQDLITQREQQFVSLASATLLPTPILPQNQQSGCSR